MRIKPRRKKAHVKAHVDDLRDKLSRLSGKVLSGDECDDSGPHRNGEASSFAQNWFGHHRMQATNESELSPATSSRKNSKTVLSQLSWKYFNHHTIAFKVSSRINVSDPGQIDALKAHTHNKPSYAALPETSPRQAPRSDTFEKASLSQNVAQQMQGKTFVSKQHRQRREVRMCQGHQDDRITSQNNHQEQYEGHPIAQKVSSRAA